MYPTCLTHTATGRVSLAEPSLQNIPKDFDVELTDDLKARALGKKHLTFFLRNIRFCLVSHTVKPSVLRGYMPGSVVDPD